MMKTNILLFLLFLVLELSSIAQTAIHSIKTWDETVNSERPVLKLSFSIEIENAYLYNTDTTAIYNGTPLNTPTLEVKVFWGENHFLESCYIPSEGNNIFKGSVCLDPNRIRSWNQLDDKIYNIKFEFKNYNPTKNIWSLTSEQQKEMYKKYPLNIYANTQIQITNNFTKIIGNSSNQNVISNPINSVPIQNKAKTPVVPPVLNTVTKIEIEKNSITKVPYSGLVADGTGSLRISLNGLTGDKVKFEIPYGMGSLKYKGGIQAINESKIDEYISISNGSATVYFHPPQYLDPDLLTSQTTINGRQVWCMNTPIRFTYRDAAGNIQSENLKISILRPMVFMVHGFTGDASTWAGLADHLNKRRFDTRAENYYEQNDGFLIKSQDVFAQSRKLSENIDQAKKEYSASNIKMLKIDIVSHSMGGLIARYYAHGYSAYSNDVRKLFMVGTPNHGIGNSKQLLGACGSAASWSHFGMLADVHEESDFMMNLNKNETTGAHLNPNVEYYNIFGTVDDGVTNAASAYMPGVMFTQIRKCCHSPFPPILKLLGTPLTIHPDVYSRITAYLQKEIMRMPLKNVKAEIVSQRGEVWVDRGTEDWHVTRTPYKVTPYDKIRSKEKSSMTISFTMDGKEWGRLVTGQNTSLQLKNYSPQTFTVRVVKGKARFISNSDSHFQVEIMPDQYNKLEWYSFAPKVDINGLGTTFEVIYENGIAKVNLIEGEIRMDDNQSDTFESFSTPQSLVVNENGGTSSQSLQIDNELKQLDSTDSINNSTNPLFSNVTIGGTNMINSSNNNSPTNNYGSSTGSCLGKLKVQFIVPVGAPSTQQQQFQLKALSDQNNWELRWFQQAEAAFKNGKASNPLSGTYRPDPMRNPGKGKYFSETVTLFKPMKIQGTNGLAEGFRLVHGDSHKEQHFAPIGTADGTVLPCGSYKIYVDPYENRDKSWVTINFVEEGASIQPPQNGGGNNPPSNPPSTSKPQSCIDQMQVQFIQKTGAVNDPQGRMIMMKIDDENKRELSWFNRAADNYKRGIMPREMSGTYRRQQNTSPLTREYYSETITLFEPMKIINPSGNSHGFRLMKGMVEFRKFSTNQEAEGVVLPCGSYKVYPSDDMPFSAAKFQLVKN